MMKSMCASQFPGALVSTWSQGCKAKVVTCVTFHGGEQPDSMEGGEASGVLISLVSIFERIKHMQMR